MARSWTEFLGDAEGPYETQEAQRSFVGRLRESLSKSRRALTEQLAVAAFDPADDGSWERLEEALIHGEVAAGGDVVVIDTAGRLHTQTNLMDELVKVRRVIAGRLEGAPHETLLVVDATTGQNAIQQARLFNDAVGVTGVALTKLDGSARGGVAVAIAYELGLPVKLIGVGEGLDDLRPFDPRDFAQALVAP